jgi:hypothetical protein
MLRRSVALASLGCLAVLACGDRYGDPIVAVEAPTSQAGVDAAGEGGTGGGTTNEGGTANEGGRGGATNEPAAGAAGASETPVGPTGLCGACSTSQTCSDANDACLIQDGERFCGRDCDEGRGCPDGYVCVELENSPLLQCVPVNGCRVPAPTPPSLPDIREHLLARINAERLARDRSSLLPSSCLDGLAQESALDYARSDEPLGKFVKECDPIWPNCDCGWNAQAEVAVAVYGLDWASAIEHALGTDDRFINSFLDFAVTSVGIGFWISGDEAWIALSFR